MAYDEGLAERIRDVMGEQGALIEKKMFGGLAFMLGGHMCCGVIADRLMARVGPENYGAALARPFVRQMDFTGRPMKGYVYVEPDGVADDADLRDWVVQCAAFVATLPPKRR